VTPQALRISSAVAPSATLLRATMVSVTPSPASAMAQPLPSHLISLQMSALFRFMPKSNCFLSLFRIEIVNSYLWFQPLAPAPQGMRLQSVQPGTKL
jgi:hypothetical protein